MYLPLETEKASAGSQKRLVASGEVEDRSGKLDFAGQFGVGFEQLLGTMRSILPLLRAEQARAQLLVSLYGCTNSCIYREEAHRAVDPWREENPVKKNKQQLIRRLDDYDRWLGHCPNAAGPERTAVIG